jgi:hypothetical protein
LRLAHAFGLLDTDAMPVSRFGLNDPAPNLKLEFVDRSESPANNIR